MSGLRLGSLFSGIGGLDLAVERVLGARTIWQAEADPFARSVLAKHWPDVRCYHDVKEIDDAAERPDIVCGGFPCQDISNAGKRAGIGGERSGLWSEFARIIRVLRPRFVFVENSSALIDRGIDRVLGDLAALGFDAEWSCIGACQAGRPHTRNRVFVLAYSDSGAIAFGVRARKAGQEPVSKGADREMPEGIRLESDGELQRMADGLPRAVDRLAVLGNACSPQQAALALETLMTRARAAQTEAA